MRRRDDNADHGAVNWQTTSREVLSTVLSTGTLEMGRQEHNWDHVEKREWWQFTSVGSLGIA